MPHIDWGLTGTKQVMESEFSATIKGNQWSIIAAEKQGWCGEGEGNLEGGWKEENQLWHHRWNVSRVPAATLTLLCDKVAQEGYIRTSDGTEGKSVLSFASQCSRIASVATEFTLTDRDRSSGPPGEDRRTWKRRKSTSGTHGTGQNSTRTAALYLLAISSEGCSVLCPRCWAGIQG